MRRLALLLCLAAAPALAQELPAVSATPVPLDPADPTLGGVGKLSYRGGLLLESGDPRFGGWSDLLLEAGGARLVAVGDLGAWMTADLAWDAQGRLTGLTPTGFGQLADPAGQPLQGKELGDAEGLTSATEGGYLVAFEQVHRLWRYTPDLAAPAVEAKMPTAVLGLKPELGNAGMEALARLPDGTLLVFLEGAPGEGGTLGFRQGKVAWRPLPYLRQDAFDVVGAAALDNGALLVLERQWTPAAGSHMRLRLFSAAQVGGSLLQDGQLLGELAPPLTVDNFEGVAVATAPDGALRVLLLSDDNFNRGKQRTLLLAFELALD
jgi:hypothetical protein